MKKKSQPFAWHLIFALGFALAAGLFASTDARATERSAPPAASFEQNLGAQIPLDAVFRDEAGNPVALRSLLGTRPAILILGYHECPMLCSLVLGATVETLTEMRSSTGKDFDLIDVSINPADTSEAAAKQKRIYLKRYARAGSDTGWHFLTSPDPANVRALADAVGFHYAYDPKSGQYAHPSGLVVLTPNGKISRYFFGLNYDAGDLQTALNNASNQQVGSPVAQLLLLCFHYNPLTGKYGALILYALRTAGVVTLLVMAVGIFWLTRRIPQQTPT